MDTNKKIALKTIEYIPGLYKLFDEGIVNCRDHVIRMMHSPLLDKHFVTSIQVTIEEATGAIHMENDGNGIDVAKHPEYGIWIPEMIFGHLRTSTNYNKEEKKIVGGKNGFGFKLVLIWSSYGRIETIDHVRGLKYVQEFHNNLDRIGEPIITKVKMNTKPYTKITFIPDYNRLGIRGLTMDMMSLFQKRVHDIAAITDHSARKIKVSFNGEPVGVKQFQHYVDLYLGSKEETKRVYEQFDERWEYAVALSPTHEFVQISFVNGIATHKGGKHVDMIVGQITRKLCDYIEKKKKIKVNPTSIKEQLILFLRCDVENPSFDSQTKDCMNTPVNKFGGSYCTVSDGFIEKVAKMGVMELACSLTEAKESRMAKKTDGVKTKTIRGIANFIDANLSGTAQSKDCVLILCEGLSALSGIVSGLSSEDRNTIGIYPLKGKLLNVRGETVKKISENKEITDIKKIIGLETGKEYATWDDVHRHLRYGKIMFMTDQDLDGSHIKGLCINLFHSEWASLLKLPGFLSFMNTPILRAKKGQQTLLFYNEGEYDLWRRDNATQGWTIKYFKGLGTSTSNEFKEYFANKKVVDFMFQDSTDNTIDKIFNKKRADDRKSWLEQYNKDAYLDTNKKNVSYEEFVDQELIHFSTYDCQRSIPNAIDGLKTSLRKILYCAFKRRLTSEVKVAQFSGYVSEHSSYHHGEASLNGAIVNMAQTFVGSNNINLLEPNGQFGTRLQGGDDSASERYIFTQLNGLTRHLFPEADDPILNYLNDDGTSIEPEYYVPILPFVLINGQTGIGTGFSCSIPSYHPSEIMRVLQKRLKGESGAFQEADGWVPYYEGFKGRVEKAGENRFLIRGCYEKVGEDSIRITELPVGTWTMPYIGFLEGLVDGGVDKNGKKVAPVLKDFTSVCTELVVDIVVQFPRGKLAEMGPEDMEKLLKLTTTVSTTNIHLFNGEFKLRKYNGVQDILEDHYVARMAGYAKRKAHLEKQMAAFLNKIQNRVKYILETLDGTMDLRKKSADQVTALLSGYDKIDGDYKYLVKMPMDSVTNEHVDSMKKELVQIEGELRDLRATTHSQMWLKELAKLEEAYEAYRVKRSTVSKKEPTVAKKAVKKAASK